MDIEIHLDSDSPAYQRGCELAKGFLLSSSKPEELLQLCKEVLGEAFQKRDASILASVVYSLAMVSVGLRRALELEEDPRFADEIVAGLWSALEESPVPTQKGNLKLDG